MDYKETGQACYETYARYLLDRRGTELPPWESLYDVERDAWRAGAHAAIQEGWQRLAADAVRGALGRICISTRDPGQTDQHPRSLPGSTRAWVAG